MPEKCPKHDEGRQIAFLSKLKEKIIKDLLEVNVWIKKKKEKKKKNQANQEE